MAVLDGARPNASFSLSSRNWTVPAGLVRASSIGGGELVRDVDQVVDAHADQRQRLV